MRPHAVGRVLGSVAQAHRHLNVLVPAQFARHGAEDLRAPALGLGVALVHAKEVSGEEGGLLAAGAGLHLDDGIAGVVGVPGDERVLKGRLGLGESLLQAGYLGAEELGVLSSEPDDLAGLVQVGAGREECSVDARDPPQFGVAAPQSPHLLRRGEHGGAGHVSLDSAVFVEHLLGDSIRLSPSAFLPPLSLTFPPRIPDSADPGRTLPAHPGQRFHASGSCAPCSRIAHGLRSRIRIGSHTHPFADPRRFHACRRRCALSTRTRVGASGSALPDRRRPGLDQQRGLTSPARIHRPSPRPEPDCAASTPSWLVSSSHRPSPNRAAVNPRGFARAVDGLIPVSRRAQSARTVRAPRWCVELSEGNRTRPTD